MGRGSPRFAHQRRLGPRRHPQVRFEGVDSLYPDCRAGRPPTLTLSPSIKRLAPGRPKDHLGLRSTWSLAKLAHFFGRRGWSTTSATRGCRCCSARREGVASPPVYLEASWHRAWNDRVEPRCLRLSALGTFLPWTYATAKAETAKLRLEEE